MHITTIGLDLAKHWFQVHGVDTAGKVVVKRRLRRTEVGAFSAPKNPAWLEWKPARRRTIGRAS
jgi:transposase